MKLFILKVFILLTLASNFQSCYRNRCYSCEYDMTTEILCLKNGSFTFRDTVISREVSFIEGTYKINGDTLIFNEGIYKEGAHKFFNENKLVRNGKNIHYINGKGELSGLYFEPKD